MSALRTGCSSEGEESVKAGDGLDEAATNSAAPAMAASKPVGTKRDTIISYVSAKGTVYKTLYPPIWFRLETVFGALSPQQPKTASLPAGSTRASGSFDDPRPKPNGSSFAGAGQPPGTSGALLLSRMPPSRADTFSRGFSSRRSSRGYERTVWTF
jgi:hypothetical protein